MNNAPKLTIGLKCDRLAIGSAIGDLWEIGRPLLTADNGFRHENGGWRNAHQTSFISDSDILTCCVRASTNPAGQPGWRLDFVCMLKAEGSFSLTIPQLIHLQDVEYLHETYNWKPLVRRARVMELTPGHVEGQCAAGMVSLRYWGHAALLLDGDEGVIELLIDSPWRHPQKRFGPEGLDAAASPSGRGRQRCLSAAAAICLHTGQDNRRHEPVAWRYPYGRLSCFTVTDHGDWDRADKLSALFLGRNGTAAGCLRITKSVFWQTTDCAVPGKPQPEGLDVPGFRHVADAMNAEGHEICPHSVAVRPREVSGQIPLSDLHNALDFFARRYQSGTWIDHGCSEGQAFNYPRQGHNRASCWHLVDLLREHGFTAIWSYIDGMRYPVSNMDQLAMPDGGRKYFLAALGALARAQFWKSLNYGKRFLEAVNTGAEAGETARRLQAVRSLLLKKSVHPPGWREACGLALALPRDMARAIRRRIAGEFRPVNVSAPLPVLFGEPDLPLGQIGADDLVLFTTSLDNNFAAAWGRMDDLVRQRGLHVAHMYLCHTGLLYGDSALVCRGARWVWSHPFSAIITDLNHKIQSGEIWNPTMKELAAWFKAWMRVSVQDLQPNMVSVTNKSSVPLNGFSLMFPESTVEVSVNHQTLTPTRIVPRLYCFDLPAGCEVTVQWK